MKLAAHVSARYSMCQELLTMSVKAWSMSDCHHNVVHTATWRPRHAMLRSLSLISVREQVLKDRRPNIAGTIPRLLKQNRRQWS